MRDTAGEVILGNVLRDLKFSRRINELKFRAISSISVELKTNVSDNSFVVFIGIDLVNDRISLIYTYISVCQVDTSSY
jgi:hypothetical protein